MLSLPGASQQNSLMLCYRVRMLGNVRHGNKTYSQRAVCFVVKCVVAGIVADVSAVPPAAVLCRSEMKETRTNLLHKTTTLFFTEVEL